MRQSHVIFILAGIALAAAFFTTAAHAYVPQYSPSEIAVDSDGNVYTIMNIDSATGEGIFVYAPNGTGIKAIRRPGCTDIAIDARGTIYVLNIVEKRVERLEESGSFGVVWRESDPDRFINYFAIDHDDNLLVSDFNYSRAEIRVTDGRILKISPEGRVVGIIESSPTFLLNNTFEMSVGGNGTIYISDFSRHFRAIYPDGTRSTIGHTSPDNGTFSQVTEVTSGDDGYLYVGEMSDGRIQKLATDGTVVARWEGCGPDRFIIPSSIVADRNGRVYVSDMQNQRIVWFDSNRYRFGENAADNLAGKGVLWDNVIAGDNYTISHQNERGDAGGKQTTPGFAIITALTGLVSAGAFLLFGRQRKI